MFRAVYDYVAQSKDELDIHEGDIIELISEGISVDVIAACRSDLKSFLSTLRFLWLVERQTKRKGRLFP